jgi:uncharacterized membrane protein YjfL (UPF0719 family)
MKGTWIAMGMLLLALAVPAGVLGAEAAGGSTWHAASLWEAVLHMLLFAAVGIAGAVAGYKVFDCCTPGDLQKEIFENRNVAAAVVAGAVILGICLIIAAAMIG